jgi:hypothetical protein
MNRKMVLGGLAALTLAASAAPATAQGFSVGVGFGDYGYDGWSGDYGYYRPGVSIGFGAPGWGYDNWSYGSYAAAPCTCGTSYRTTRVAPRYRSYAYGEYPSDYDYAYYPYDDYYYGGSYASVGLGWSDNGWRGGRLRDRDRDRDRFTREDRVRVGERDFRSGRNEFRDRNGREEFRDRGGLNRAAVRTSETRSMTRGSGEFRGSVNGDIRAGANAEFRGGTRSEIGGSARRGGAAAATGTRGSGRRGGDNR